MKRPFLSYLALSISATAAMLLGCGGSQPPIDAPGAMPQSRAIATYAERGGSWMLPEAKHQVRCCTSRADAAGRVCYPTRAVNWLAN